MKAEVSGYLYMDTNANGRQDRFEVGASGLTVQLLDSNGTIMDTTVTGRDGRYRFNSFHETGQYQVRVVLLTNLAAAKTTRDVLISRGGMTLSGMNFALSLA